MAITNGAEFPSREAKQDAKFMKMIGMFLLSLALIAAGGTIMGAVGTVIAGAGVTLMCFDFAYGIYTNLQN